jgi:hypothetical protein
MKKITSNHVRRTFGVGSLSSGLLAGIHAYIDRPNHEINGLLLWMVFLFVAWAVVLILQVREEDVAKEKNGGGR